MPSRPGIVLILVFWLAVVGKVVFRDVLPRYTTDTPSVQIDLADEATRSIRARWGIYRGEKRVGALYTGMEPDDKADAFRFTSDFQDLNEVVFGATVKCPRLQLATILRRDGSLLGETMKGELAIDASGVRFQATATVTAEVVDGMLVGRCTVKSTLIDFDEPLPPTPLTGGPVLHPLQPMNRLANVRPGQRWKIVAVDPLSDAMKVLMKKVLEKYGFASIDVPATSQEFDAEVQGEPVLLELRGKAFSCWLIEYRNDKATARTWVAVADGKVLRQEAKMYGETLRLDREE